MLVTLLGHFQGALEQLAVEPEQIAGRADRLCLQHGQTLALQLGGRTISGRCAGIAPDGALRLETAQGPRTFRSGVLCH